MRRLLFVLVLGLIVLTFAACGGGKGGKREPTATAPPPTTAPTTVADLAKSVVQIVALDSSQTPVWWGSGTVVSADGYILTNAHVVDDRSGDYDSLGVAVTKATDKPPEPSYIAEIAAVDYVLDLAVIHVTTDLDGNAAQLNLPPVKIGDSDAVEIGDGIRILGFPGIGGETITFTEGAVSGFTSQREIADRAWIKTDATIAGGNSGGLAVNAAGEIIGVPTIVGSSAGQDQPVDCRYVVDTNRDGTVDTNDTCVPVGGFINGLRPVALALPLIQAAEAGRTYVSVFGSQTEPTPSGGFDTANVLFNRLTFSPDVTSDDQPTAVVQTLPTGSTSACAFWDYKGMLDGVSWEALWFVDGQLDQDGSITDDTWVGGESGNWWVCDLDDKGLSDGLYEVVISVAGDFQASDAIYIGGAHPPVDFTVNNQSSTAVCYALISPADAKNWGQDRLGADEKIEAGTSHTFTMPSSTYDLMLLDCDLNNLAEKYDIDATTGTTYALQ